MWKTVFFSVFHLFSPINRQINRLKTVFEKIFLIIFPYKEGPCAESQSNMTGNPVKSGECDTFKVRSWLLTQDV